MPEGLIDTARFKAHQDRTREEVRRSADPPKIISRASIHLIADQLKEARVQQFTLRCDEATERGGGGTAPSPLQYFVAAIGF